MALDEMTKGTEEMAANEKLVEKTLPETADNAADALHELSAGEAIVGPNGNEAPHKLGRFAALLTEKAQGMEARLSTEASWTQEGSKMIDGIREGLNNARTALAEKLGINTLSEIKDAGLKYGRTVLKVAPSAITGAVVAAGRTAGKAVGATVEGLGWIGETGANAIENTGKAAGRATVEAGKFVGRKVANTADRARARYNENVAGESDLYAAQAKAKADRVNASVQSTGYSIAEMRAHEAQTASGLTEALQAGRYGDVTRADLRKLAGVRQTAAALEAHSAAVASRVDEHLTNAGAHEAEAARRRHIAQDRRAKVAARNGRL
jgi:hypothetical protein